MWTVSGARGHSSPSLSTDVGGGEGGGRGGGGGGSREKKLAGVLSVKVVFWTLWPDAGVLTTASSSRIM